TQPLLGGCGGADHLARLLAAILRHRNVAPIVDVLLRLRPRFCNGTGKRLQRVRGKAIVRIKYQNEASSGMPGAEIACGALSAVLLEEVFEPRTIGEYTGARVVRGAVIDDDELEILE